MQSHKTSAILRRLQEHGQEELTRLFMSHRPYLRRLIAARLHASLLRRLDASDIVQEVYMRASKTLSDYLASPTIHPIVWLRILCKQLLAENVRKQCRDKRNPALETQDIGDAIILDELANSWLSAGEALTRAEQIEQVRCIVESMPETDREIIDMRHADGYSFREIADQLEVRMETAKKRYYRAIERFRKLAIKQMEVSS